MELVVTFMELMVMITSIRVTELVVNTNNIKDVDLVAINSD